MFTPLESPDIHGGDDKNKVVIPYRKGGVKVPSFLTGLTSSLTSTRFGIIHILIFLIRSNFYYFAHAISNKVIPVFLPELLFLTL